jgi:hypothetical protein
MATLVVCHDAAEERSPVNLKCHHEVHTKERKESPNTLSINISLYLPISIYSRDHTYLAPFFCKNPCSKLPICRLLSTIDLHHAPSSDASLINIHIGRNLHRILVAKNKKRHFHTFHDANRAPKSIVTQQEPHHDIAPTSSWRTKEQHT